MRLRLAYVETALALALAWALVFIVPTRWTLPLFGTAKKSMAGTAPAATEAALARARGVAVLLNRMDRRLPWHSTCLVRALAGRIMLARRGIRGSVVRFGVNLDDGKLAAHAWLMLGNVTLLGGSEAAAFTPIADLA